MKSLSVQEIDSEKRKEVDSIPLIDVRTPAEFGSVHAEGANHPMESLDVERLLFWGKEDEDSSYLSIRWSFDEGLSKTGGCWIFECRKCGGGTSACAGKWIAGG